MALTNFCKREIMSVCTASAYEQENCAFFELASHEKRCMYFIFDEHCDCLKAQIDAPAPVEGEVTL